jgi:hypothetical protein
MDSRQIEQELADAYELLASIHRGFAEVKLQGVQRWRVV